MNRSPKTTRGLAAAGAVLIVLLGSACGSSQLTEPATAEPTADESEIAPSATESSSSGGDLAALEAWVGGIDEAWSQLGHDRERLFLDHHTSVQNDESISPFLTWLRSEAGLYDDFAKRLDDVPIDSVIEPSAASFATAVRNASTTLGSAADDMKDGDNNAATDALTDMFVQVRIGCFKLQEAAGAANLALIDCAGSADAPTVPVPESDELPILAVGSYDAVDAGSYRIEGFARPFTVTLPESMRLTVHPRNIELAPAGDEGPLEFSIVAPDDLPVPGTPYGAIGDTVPFPDELGSWLAEIPVTVSDSGTTQVGDISVPYWTIPLPDDALQEDVDQWVFAEFDYNYPILPLREGTTLWQVPHPDGPFVVLGMAKFEIPGAPGLDEMTAFMESILVTIEVPEGPSDSTRAEPDPDDDPDSGGDAALDDIRTAVMNMVGAEAAIEDFPPTTGVYCDDPPFDTTLFDLEPTWIGYGTENGFVQVLEFTSATDRDAFFVAAEEVRPDCIAKGSVLIEPELIDAVSGEHFTLLRTTEYEGDVFTVTEHVRKVGQTGLLFIDSESSDNIVAALTELGLS